MKNFYYDLYASDLIDDEEDKEYEVVLTQEELLNYLLSETDYPTIAEFENYAEDGIFEHSLKMWFKGYGKLLTKAY